MLVYLQRPILLMHNNRLSTARGSAIHKKPTSLTKPQDLQLTTPSNINPHSQRRCSHNYVGQKDKQSKSKGKLQIQSLHNKKQEDYSLQIDAIYTELQDELIQLKNSLIGEIQVIMESEHIQELKKIQMCQLLAKSRETATQIKTILHRTSSYPCDATQAARGSWEQALRNKIALRITQALLQQE